MRVGCPGYLRAWPQVESFIASLDDDGGDVAVIEDLGRALLDRLGRGDVDLAVILGPAPDGALRTEVIGEEPLVVALPSAHLLATADAVIPERLRSERLVVFPRDTNPALYDFYLDVLAALGVRPEVVEEPEREGTRGGVGAGLGYALVARRVADTPVDGVVHRPFAGAEPVVEVRVVWRAGEERP